MERLKVEASQSYDPIEATIHVGRYALAIPFAAGRRVLDASCGEGYGAWLLADAGAEEVVGVDISSNAIDVARANFRHYNLRYEIINGESLGDLLPLCHFDLVVSIETIEHVKDPEAFLHNLRRVATPDAIFILTCPNDNWYYGDGEGNPHHLRRLSLDQFKVLTTAILGDRVEWLLGSATRGFATVPVDHEQNVDSTRSLITQAGTASIALRVPSGDATGPSSTNCSYFVGVWNAAYSVGSAGAYQALSMDMYSRMMWLETNTEYLADLEAEVTTLRSRQEVLSNEVASLSLQREFMSADIATANAQRDAKIAEAAAALRETTIVGIQAAALRRENEIVSSQLLALRAELDNGHRHTIELDNALALQFARVNLLEVDLAWHIARVASLDEALAWHVSRIQVLETESLGRLVRRAASRFVLAVPLLAKLVSRLRRRRVVRAEPE